MSFTFFIRSAISEVTGSQMKSPRLRSQRQEAPSGRGACHTCLRQQLLFPIQISKLLAQRNYEPLKQEGEKERLPCTCFEHTLRNEIIVCSTQMKYSTMPVCCTRSWLGSSQRGCLTFPSNHMTSETNAPKQFWIRNDSLHPSRTQAEIYIVHIQNQHQDAENSD